MSNSKSHTHAASRQRITFRLIEQGTRGPLYQFRDRRTHRWFQVRELDGPDAASFLRDGDGPTGHRFFLYELEPNGRVVRFRGRRFVAAKDVPAARWAALRESPAAAVAAVRALEAESPGFDAVYSGGGYGTRTIFRPTLGACVQIVRVALITDTRVLTSEPLRYGILEVDRSECPRLVIAGPSSKGDTQYVVRVDAAGAWSCSCPAAHFRPEVLCKHARAVRAEHPAPPAAAVASTIELGAQARLQESPYAAAFLAGVQQIATAAPSEVSLTVSYEAYRPFGSMRVEADDSDRTYPLSCRALAVFSLETGQWGDRMSRANVGFARVPFGSVLDALYGAPVERYSETPSDYAALGGIPAFGQ